MGSIELTLDGETGAILARSGRVSAMFERAGKVWVTGTAGEPPCAAGFEVRDLSDLEAVVGALRASSQRSEINEYLEERQLGSGL